MMDSARILFALARHFNWWQQKMLPEFEIGGLREDLVVVSRAGYATVVEIKVSRNDWLRDSHKPRWPSKHISRFFYAVPADVYARGVPSNVPEFCGVLAIGRHQDHHGFDIVRTERPAQKNFKAEKLPDERVKKIEEAFYYRFWRQYMDLQQNRLLNTQKVSA